MSFRYADELVREHQPGSRMAPTHQGFNTHQLTTGDRYRGLVIVYQLAVGDSGAPLVSTEHRSRHAALVPPRRLPFPNPGPEGFRLNRFAQISQRRDPVYLHEFLDRPQDMFVFATHQNQG